MIPLSYAESLIDERARRPVGGDPEDGLRNTIELLFEDLPVPHNEVEDYVERVHEGYHYQTEEGERSPCDVVVSLALETLATGVMVGAAESGESVAGGLVEGKELDAAMARAALVTEEIHGPDLQDRVNGLVEAQMRLAEDPDHLEQVADLLQREDPQAGPADAVDFTMRTIVGSSFTHGISVGLEVARARQRSRARPCKEKKPPRRAKPVAILAPGVELGKLDA